MKAKKTAALTAALLVAAATAAVVFRFLFFGDGGSRTARTMSRG